MGTTVTNLKRVTVKFTAAAGEDAQEPVVGEGVVFSFIYGAASGGLTPFELELAGRGVEERCSISVDGQAAPGYFGHLWRELLRNLELPILPRRLDLAVQIVAIDEPPQREVIKAMAAAVGGECGPGCGCGCH